MSKLTKEDKHDAFIKQWNELKNMDPKDIKLSPEQQERIDDILNTTAKYGNPLKGKKDDIEEALTKAKIKHNMILAENVKTEATSLIRGSGMVSTIAIIVWGIGVLPLGWMLSIVSTVAIIAAINLKEAKDRFDELTPKG